MDNCIHPSQLPSAICQPDCLRQTGTVISAGAPITAGSLPLSLQHGCTPRLRSIHLAPGCWTHPGLAGLRPLSSAPARWLVALQIHPARRLRWRLTPDAVGCAADALRPAGFAECSRHRRGSSARWGGPSTPGAMNRPLRTGVRNGLDGAGAPSSLLRLLPWTGSNSARLPGRGTDARHARWGVPASGAAWAAQSAGFARGRAAHRAMFWTNTARLA